jgi:hypothetical protein
MLYHPGTDNFNLMFVFTHHSTSILFTGEK